MEDPLLSLQPVVGVGGLEKLVGPDPGQLEAFVTTGKQISSPVHSSPEPHVVLSDDDAALPVSESTGDQLGRVLNDLMEVRNQVSQLHGQLRSAGVHFRWTCRWCSGSMESSAAPATTAATAAGTVVAATAGFGSV